MVSKFSLDSSEKYILFKKYKKNGLSNEDAKNRVNSFCNSLKNLKQDLQSVKNKEIDMNPKFKQEFENLCQNIEAGNINLELK